MSVIAVRSISLYPIKSLDPVVVEAARILSTGALEHDREFALFDEQGDRLNGKRDARIHGIRAHYDLPQLLVTLRTKNAPSSAEEGAGGGGGQANDFVEPTTPYPLLSQGGGIFPSRTFHLVDNQRELEDWFGNYFGFRVSVQRNTRTGFPDDLEAAGPTIIGSSTIQEVGSWFEIPDPAETERRFRASIEIATESPFWEDCLFGEPGTPLTFRIGDVTVHGVNPCQRCVVPSRNPSTGAPTPDFQRVFAVKREETLPSWAAQSHFNHYYRLAVNTRIAQSEAGKFLRPGDLVIR